MADALIAERLLLGNDRSAVVALLGMPDASDTTDYSFDYAVDLGRRTGPWGMGGTWLFYTSVCFDTLSGDVIEVRTRD